MPKGRKYGKPPKQKKGGLPARKTKPPARKRGKK